MSTAPATTAPDPANIGRLIKQKVFAVVGYDVRTQEVADFHSSTARTRIVHAPARTSKSYAAAHEALYHCFPTYEQLDDKRFAFIREPTGDRRIWLIGPDYKTVKEWDYLWDILVVRKRRLALGRMYKIVSKSNNAHQGNLRIVMEFPPDRDGNPVRVYVEGKSASNPESLQGEQVYLAVLSEAAEHDEKVLARYLGTRTRHTILPTTPKLSADWLHRLIAEGAEHPELSIESFQFTPYANPHYDWDLFWIEHAKAESRATGQIITPPRGHDCFADPAGCAARRDPWFAEQFCGEWTGADERLLPFGSANLLDAVPDWVKLGAPRTFVSCDYGYSDAAVALWWAIGERDGLVLVAEVYEQHLTATDFVSAVNAKSRALGITPDYYVGDPKQPQIARLMRDRGLPVWDIDKKAMADRAAGFHAIVDALTIDPVTGVPRLRLVQGDGDPWGCPRTIGEWKNLRRKTDRNAIGEFAQGAVVGDDHAADACFIAGTRILTDRGKISIADVKPGDRAWTRDGWRDVTAAWCEGEKPTYVATFDTGHMVEATGNHPLWVEGTGWVRLDALRYGDPCVFASTAVPSTSLQAGATSVPLSVQADARLRSIYTEQCGRPSTERSRPATTSTTGTAIGRTTTSTTWNSSADPSTSASILARMWRRFVATAKRFTRAERGECGIVAVPGVGGIASTQNEAWSWHVESQQPAIAAESLSQPPLRNSDSARTLASHAGDGTSASTTLSVSALTAARHSAATDTTGLVRAHGVARSVSVVRTSERKLVYNLTVDGAHEYFANDILAKNCRYGIMTRPRPRVLQRDNEIRRYVDSLRRRSARKAQPSLHSSGRLVGGAPRMNAHA